MYFGYSTVLPVARNCHSEIQLAYIVQKSVVSYVFIVQEMVSVQERVREDFGARKEEFYQGKGRSEKLV